MKLVVVTSLIILLPCVLSIHINTEFRCDMCNIMLNDTIYLIKQAKHPTYDLLKKCDKYFSYEISCYILVNTYLSDMVYYLLKNNTKQKICESYGYCPTNIHKLFYDHDVCMYIVSLGKKHVEEGNIEFYIHSKLLNACELLPNIKKISCQHLVYSIYPDFTVYLRNKFSPSQICGVNLYKSKI